MMRKYHLKQQIYDLGHQQQDLDTLFERLDTLQAHVKRESQLSDVEKDWLSGHINLVRAYLSGRDNKLAYCVTAKIYFEVVKDLEGRLLTSEYLKWIHAVYFKKLPLEDFFQLQEESALS